MIESPAMRWTFPVVAIALLVAMTSAAFAHQSSVKYVDVTLDGPRASIAFTIAPQDVTEPLGLPNDAIPSVAAATVPVVAPYIRNWLAVALPDQTACVAGEATVAPDGEQRFVVVRWVATCPAPIERVRLDFTRFFAVDQRHEAVVSVHGPAATGKGSVVRANGPVVVLGIGEAASFAAWIGYGMDHIYGGLDHVLFLIALLLVVVLQREGPRWRSRDPFAALRATAIVVTGFTVAHSVSLIAASLGYVRLPSALVESVIAASIIYTAIENVVRPDAGWRFWITIGFGFVHGLGFASMLEELLPPADVVVPLLGFNLGVELGQLTIVVVALPVLWGISRAAGGDRYRRFGLSLAAIPLVVIGIKWLLERVGM